ncbi:unnamed protein product [Effrenium voratum]|uniref:Uncharacterized protein n=1 Tax=Effrenium voratum TaxID=2562239 RepID=A0AA36NFH2_9DINO|nr:unnamed protein product [Effrenium voratum]
MPDAALDSAVEFAVKRVMEHADFAGKFKHPVKFNGTDFVEQRLSSEQQLAEVTRSACRQMHVFLERYGGMLGAEETSAPWMDKAYIALVGWMKPDLRQLAPDSVHPQKR